MAQSYVVLTVPGKVACRKLRTERLNVCASSLAKKNATSAPLFVDQVAVTDLLKLLQVFLPIERDAMRILATSERIIYTLAGKNFKHLFHVELLWVQFRQRRRQFHAEFGRIEK